MKIEALKRTQRKKEQEVKMSKKEEVILKLLGLNIEADEAQDIVEKILEDDKLEVNEIVIKAIQEISGYRKKKGKVRSRNIETVNEKDIRVIVEQGRKNSLSGYESLKEKGIIKEYNDDFLKLGEVI
jgi:hypothetical protein